VGFLDSMPFLLDVTLAEDKRHAPRVGKIRTGLFQKTGIITVLASRIFILLLTMKPRSHLIAALQIKVYRILERA
jgi:hypothetical protein